MLKDSKIISFSLIGCGRIAKRHSDLLGNNIIKNAKLICDVKDLASYVKFKSKNPNDFIIKAMKATKRI